MKKVCILMTAAVMMLAACSRKDDNHQSVLEGFYNEYLALNCPPEGEYPDWVEVQKLVQRYLTLELFSEWELSHNAELDSWIDYDMFIQGQDCWPGIRAEHIERIEGSQWYVVEVVQPEMDNPDSIQKSERVFFHLEECDDGEWLIGCIDDRYNRLGNAPREEESALRNNPFYQDKIVIS